MSITPEMFCAISVEDALNLPNFPTRVRALVELLDQVGPDVTITQVAEVLGQDPMDYARHLCGEMILGALASLADEAARRGAMN